MRNEFSKNLLLWKEELMSSRGCLKEWPEDLNRPGISGLRNLRDSAEMWLSFTSNYRWREDKDWCIEEVLQSINKHLDDAYDELAEDWQRLQMRI